jgi:uncharacterized membrane protein
VPYVIAYVCSALAFLVLDIAWLSFAVERIYRPNLGDMLAAKVCLAPAVVFYLLYIGGLVFLAVAPALKAGSPGRAALAAAVFGLVAYATYDLTNQATMRVWSLKVTVADMAWGTFASSLAGLAGFWGARAAGRLFSAA